MNVKESVEIESGGPQPGGPAPYQNLWVPLVLVPAGIVVAIVVVFTLFGSLAGEEKSLGENLEDVVTGGKNQRTQALFNLARQAVENQRARSEGQPLPWPVEHGFAERVAAAVEAVDEDEYDIRLTLAVLLAEMERERGVDLLVDLLDLGEAQDPGGEVRFKAIANLGLVGDGRAAPSLIPLLEDPDEGLRTAAASSLGRLEGPGVREALVGALGDSSLKVRGTAAVALSKLEPPGYEAAAVLVDLTDGEVYRAVNREDPTKYSKGRDVSRNRIMALEALARLGRQEDWDHIESLRSDGDANVVDVVLRLLEERDEG